MAGASRLLYLNTLDVIGFSVDRCGKWPSKKVTVCRNSQLQGWFQNSIRGGIKSVKTFGRWGLKLHFISLWIIVKNEGRANAII